VLKGTERELLLEFRNDILRLDPDLITGWNSHGFDWPYLLERAKRVQATAFPYLDRLLYQKVDMFGYCYKKPTFAGRVAFDAMHTVRTYKERVALSNTNKPESYALNYIAQLCLGRGKVDLSIPEMRRAYEQGNLDIVADYCLEDARLPLDILEHEGLCTQLFQVASISGASLEQAFQMTNSSLVIASLAHSIHENGIVYNLPKVVKQGKFKGAFVFEPRAGLYDVLAMLDFASLYPSIIIGYNMCYTTLIDTPEPNSTTVDLPGDRQAHFTATKPGLLPTALRAFMQERSRVKKLMQMHAKGSVNYRTLDARQQAIKTVNNSFYGLLGSSLPFGFELIAESVTTFGRVAIQRTNDYLGPSYPVRQGDTDSCGIELPASMPIDEVEALCTRLAHEISEKLFNGRLTLVYEKQLRPCLIFKKKMYVGYDPSVDDLLIKGLSAKRRNIMPFVRETLQHVLQLLCRHGDAEGALSYVQARFWHLLGDGSRLVQDFVITSSIKHHSEYKGTPSLGYRVNQKLPQPLGPGERISYVHYYDAMNPKHNGSKCQGNWLPGIAIDTVLPLALMHNRMIDVYKVLEQHERELRQYFSAVSVGYANQFESLYRDASLSVKFRRGCTQCKNYDIKFLNEC
jgi:DNA polymerase elongation subunit (family B)